LAHNLALKIGEAPAWKTSDFLAKEEEDTRIIIATAQAFTDVLNNEVPLYWKDNSRIANNPLI
jgi:hypothetical protein